MFNNFLTNFEKIDIKVLGKETLLMNRIELKYKINSQYLEQLFLILLSNNFKIITINNNNLQIYKNTYYDTNNLDFFKIWNWWIKIRIREYETWQKFLEIKEKINWKSIKNRKIIQENLITYEYKKFLTKAFLKNTYSRYSFINIGLNVRITLDFDISYKYFSSEKTINFYDYILEIKWSKNIVEIIKKKFYMFDRIKFSKYKFWVRALIWK